MTDYREVRGKKVTVIGGLGIEGQDLALYFAGRGARVTVSDRKTAEAVGDRLDAMKAHGVRFSLGGNDPADVEDADIVCVSQGVPLGIPAVARARERGVPVESMTSLFFKMWEGPILGVTGSSGKTTTTLLADAVFAAAGRKHVLGGNIGLGLMSLIERSSPETWAVLEVSHTQLTLLEESPEVACLLQVTPNHLDQFSWEEYVALKRRIFEYQGPDDSVVFNADDRVCADLRSQARARQFLFSVRGDHGQDGAYVVDGRVYWRRDGRTEAVIDAAETPLRGEHNVANVAAAAAIAAACDIGAEAVARAVRGFRAPPHRLEAVASIDGVDYVNDSIATTPERTLAGIRSYDEPVVLLLGGRDKKLPLDDLMAEVKRRCRAVVCFGESGAMLARAVEAAGVPVDLVDALSSAVEAARARAKAGDVVLLSPACTSFDAYDNFEQRGADFRAVVREMAEEPV